MGNKYDQIDKSAGGKKKCSDCGRFLIGCFTILLFGAYVFMFAFVFMIKLQDESIQPYIVKIHMNTDNVTAVKSILIHKGVGNYSKELNGTHNAYLVEWKCWKKANETYRYLFR